MLAHRIIPTMLCRGRSLVKGKRFNSWRNVGHAMQATRIYQSRGVDELVLLDINATRDGREPDYQMVSELSEKCFMPLSVGGGVTCLAHVRELLRSGADKVVMNTAVIEQPALLTEITDALGCQAVVVSIDYRDGIVYTHSGQHSTGRTVREVVLQMQEAGAGEIMLTSIEREGMLCGYDDRMLREIAPLLSIPLIAHGGAGHYAHMHTAFLAGADAVAAGAMFQFEDATPAGAARYLNGQGIDVRI